MRIKIKLCAVMLVLLIIPMIIVCTVGKSSVSRYADDMAEKYYRHVIETQDKSISTFMEKCIAEAKAVSAISELRDALQGDSSPDASDRILQEICMADNNLEKIIVCKNDGIVMSSTDPSNIGMKSEELGINEIGSGNGVAGIQRIKLGTENAVVFVISKTVYSGNSTEIGTVNLVYNFAYIGSVMEASTDNIFSGAVSDMYGTMVKSPFSVCKKYFAYNELNNVQGYIEDAVNNGIESEKTYIYEDGGRKKVLIMRPVSNTDWMLVYTIDAREVQISASKYYSGTLTAAVLTVIAAIVLIGFAVYRFTKPLDMMIHVLAKKKQDNSLKFEAPANDEFLFICAELNKMLDRVFESEHRYKAIVEMTNNIVFEINIVKGTVMMSNNFNKMFSFRPKTDKLEDSFFYKCRVHKDDKARFVADVEKMFSVDTNHIQGEYRIKDIYGEFSWIMIRAAKFYDRNEVPSKIIGVIVNIDRDKKSMIDLEQRANYDALTHLYNRQCFIRSLNEEIRANPENSSLNAVMFVDLDGFKQFNDTYGHSCGDEALKFTADTLKEIAYDKGFAGRLGGDEFVIYMRNLNLYGDAGNYAKEIIDTLAAGYDSDISGSHLNVHCSIGIAFTHINGSTADDVIKASDAAMYEIKKHGKGNFAYAKNEE